VGAARSLRHGLLAVLLLLGACATLQPGGSDFDPPTVELAGIKPGRSQGLEARFDLSLRVVNPNARDLEIEGVYYELYIEGKKLLTGASAEAVTIPAYGEGQVDVSGVASLFSSFALLANLMETRPENGVDYELKAKISIAGLPTAVRISQEGSFGARQ
jgi:LEA14-like dessication related protein